MKITRVYLDVDMRQGFEGLRKISSEEKKIEISTLLFINKKMTSFKIIQNNTYIIYYKNGNRRIPLDALRYLPNSFGGSELEMNKAISQSLREKLGLTSQE